MAMNCSIYGSYMGVEPKIGVFTSQIIHFNRIFHYKPSILGYHFFLESKRMPRVHMNPDLFVTFCGRKWQFLPFGTVSEKCSKNGVQRSPEMLTEKSNDFPLKMFISSITTLVSSCFIPKSCILPTWQQGWPILASIRHTLKPTGPGGFITSHF